MLSPGMPSVLCLSRLVGSAGVELHCLRKHIDVNRLEFLPYHFLMVSVGKAGYLKYQDTTTGNMIVEHRTKLGNCDTMRQNPYNAVMALGESRERMIEDQARLGKGGVRNCKDAWCRQAQMCRVLLHLHGVAGHTNGVVTMWTPNMTAPVCTNLQHSQSLPLLGVVCQSASMTASLLTWLLWYMLGGEAPVPSGDSNRHCF